MPLVNTCTHTDTSNSLRKFVIFRKHSLLIVTDSLDYPRCFVCLEKVHVSWSDGRNGEIWRVHDQRCRFKLSHIVSVGWGVDVIQDAFKGCIFKWMHLINQCLNGHIAWMGFDMESEGLETLTFHLNQLYSPKSKVTGMWPTNGGPFNHVSTSVEFWLIFLVTPSKTSRSREHTSSDDDICVQSASDETRDTIHLRACSLGTGTQTDTQPR